MKPGLLIKMLVPACALLGVAAPGVAAIAVFTDGRIAKVAEYRVHGDEIEIVLPGGGGYTTDLLRIARIVDDEVAPDPAEIAAIEPAKGDVVFDLSYDPARKPLFHTGFDRAIDAEARLANLDAALVSAVIRAESNYNPRAVSRKGARGLMQLMPSTARRFGVRRSFDAVANIRAGVRYLKELAGRFQNRPALVLAAYNAGEETVESYGGVPPYRETVDYIRRILSWWKPAPKPPSV